MAETRSGQVSNMTGWVMFAGWLMIFTGVVQIVYGLAALFNQHWYVYTSQAAYIVNVASWGWALLLTGILLAISGWLLLRGNLFGRTMGVIVAVLNILANLGVFAATPGWSILAIVVNAVIIYAILVYGRELSS